MSNPRKVEVTVSTISTHGDGVYTVKFESDIRLPRFKPGQFLHLALDRFDPSTGFWPESRVFSIATSSSDTEVTIAYSVKGIYTARMESELCVGKKVWLKFPYGSFIIEDSIDSQGDVILVAGGTGITPFISFLQNEARTRSTRRIKLFYGIRKPPLLLFNDVIAEVQASCSQFELALSCQENIEDSPFPTTKGQLCSDNIIECYRILREPPIYLAGPPVMMNSFKVAIAAAGIAAEKIITDEWE